MRDSLAMLLRVNAIAFIPGMRSQILVVRSASSRVSGARLRAVSGARLYASPDDAWHRLENREATEETAMPCRYFFVMASRALTSLSSSSCC